MTKVLLADDDRLGARTIAAALRRAGFSVTLAGNGKAALDRLRAEPFDVLLTDWAMPRMDGIALIRRVRETVQPVPCIIMITAIDSPRARSRALDSGADDFLTKPVSGRVVIHAVRTGLARRGQPAPALDRPSPRQRRPDAAPPPFVGVVIAASTGGPGVLLTVLRTLPISASVACFVVQHAPGWMLESLATRLAQASRLKVTIARDGLQPEAGTVYLAPGDHHMVLSPGTLILRLTDDPPENFVRPAADPLFRSAAAALGRCCIGILLSGMGRDGTIGAGDIARAGGFVLAQDPETAIAPSMPKTAIEAGIVSAVCEAGEIGERAAREIESRVPDLARSDAPRRL